MATCCGSSISSTVRYAGPNGCFQYAPSERDFRRKVRESIIFMRQHGRHLLDERLEMIKRGEPVLEDVLTSIIRCKESDPSVDYEVLLDDFSTFFMAGQETTANALSFLFCEVGKRPDVIRKLQEEADNVMGSRSFIECEDLSNLEYCGQVFHETLRLYPTAPGTSRENVNELTMDGYRIPANSVMMFSFYVLHHLPYVWDNPEEFRPERFAPDAERKLMSFMPFSIGQRSCIGQQFATIEAKVLLCKFFKKFDFKLDMTQSFEIADVATIRPVGGTMISLTPRSDC